MIDFYSNLSRISKRSDSRANKYSGNIQFVNCFLKFSKGMEIKTTFAITGTGSVKL
jgi:hypothetical protein